MPLNFLVDQIAGAITSALGWRNTETSPTSWETVKKTDETLTETVKDVGTTVYKTVEDVARNGYNLVTKYWYIPVIVGGLLVGYLLIRKNPAANVGEVLAAIAAAKE